MHGGYAVTVETTVLHISHQDREQPFLSVQSIFSLRENQRARVFDYFIADLQPAMRRQTMQHHRVARRSGQ